MKAMLRRGLMEAGLRLAVLGSPLCAPSMLGAELPWHWLQCFAPPLVCVWKLHSALLGIYLRLLGPQALGIPPSVGHGYKYNGSQAFATAAKLFYPTGCVFPARTCSE